tara:strand:+ start:1288 stop:1752 length:465 start_codon:yes stop_codon:yes gene_type:complete
VRGIIKLKVKIGYKMKLKSNIVDPYVGQTAEGKKIDFDSIDSIESNEIKVFKFKSKDQYIKIYTKEFIAVCPFSGLPDVSKVKVEYYPQGGLAIELKSLKYYLISFKNVGIYQEEVTKRIYADLLNVLKTKKIKITTKYNVRGGLYTTCIEGKL